MPFSCLCSYLIRQYLTVPATLTINHRVTTLTAILSVVSKRILMVNFYQKSCLDSFSAKHWERSGEKKAISEKEKKRKVLFQILPLFIIVILFYILLRPISSQSCLKAKPNWNVWFFFFFNIRTMAAILGPTHFQKSGVGKSILLYCKVLIFRKLNSDH